ncbi:MAG: TIGR02757 family protein [Ignavibacteria bacterium]
MNALKRKLDYHYKYFDKDKISPDPLEFPRMYQTPMDIEAVGFISSVFAYGRVEQIMSVLNRLVSIIGPNPGEFIINYNIKAQAKLFSDLKHRFYTSYDISILFYILHQVYTHYGSIKRMFLLYYFEQDRNLKEPVSFFSNNMISLISHEHRGYEVTRGLEFMFPDPAKGSACKRMNLFLRWMVRRDELDFGLWKEIPKDKLVIPVDTHVARICSELGLTTLKNVSWKMAEEITENIRRYDRNDPVKYDFAICHIGMRKLKF